MKSLIYILIFVLTIALTKNANAEVTDNMKVNSSYLQNAENHLVPFDGTSHKIRYGEKKKGPQVLGALQIDSIDYNDGSVISHSETSNPIAYDPVTGAIFVVNSQRFVKPGQNVYNNAVVRILHSANGSLWDSTWIFNLNDWFGYNASISLANYSNVSDYRDIPFIVNALAYTVGSPYLQHKGGLFIPGTLRNFSQDDAVLIDGPEKNNLNTGQYWRNMKSKSIVVDNEGYAAILGSLSPTSAIYQNGNYGVMTWYFNNNEIMISDIPTIFNDKYFFPGPQTNSTYQAPMEFDFDSDGILYAAVYNFFTDQNPAGGGSRNIAVAKSTDLGTTWSDYNKMPNQLIQNYYNSVGYTNSAIVGTYDMNAFVVTKSGEYSYFFRAAFWNQGDMNFQEIHLLEAYYKNGAWGIRKIADMNGTLDNIIYSNKFSGTGNYVSKIIPNPLGCELQAVKTKDGQNVLLKWVDLTEVFEFATPWIKVSTDYRLNDNSTEERMIEGGITGAATSDVFSCYRPINSDTWTQPKNHSTDTMFNKATWIPDIIPDLHNIPLIYSVSERFNNNPQSSLYGIPYVLNMMNSSLPTFTIFTRFDADVAGDVKERKEISYINSLKDAYPNPSYDEAQISFELQFGSKISLEIYNILGEKIQVLLDGFYSEGIHTVNADLTKFDSGVYYYTLTAGNQRATKVLNVIK